MTTFAQKKLSEIVLYILEKTGGVDIYHLLKIIYFAEKKHLCEWGCSITSTPFTAYEYGPVPEQVYKPIHGKDNEAFPVAYASGDASSVLLGQRKSDIDYLSKSDIECLDASINENVSLTFEQLLKKSHDAAWKEAWESNGDKVMNYVSIAKAAGASEGTLAYIAEQEAVNMALA